VPKSSSVVTLLMCVFSSGNIWACHIPGAQNPVSEPPPSTVATPVPAPFPGPAPASTPAPEERVVVPGDLLDLTNWYLTLPTGPKGDPDTVHQPQLASYRGEAFRLNDAGDGVIFTAPAGGTTTKNSKYPRSELREMRGSEMARWSNTSGTHTLTARQAVTALPTAKPEIVTAQIHGGDDDVMQVRLEGKRLLVQYDDGKREITIDPSYVLGRVFDVKIVAAGSRVQVYYNGVRKAEIKRSGSGWYFKAGSYVQSNTSKGDEPTACGQVVIYSLTVTHST
jgi:hypothetical protein